MTAPAPLAAAIEEAREILAELKMWPMSGTAKARLEPALRSLLLALDTDDRLAKAEAALRCMVDRICVTGGEVTGDYRECHELGVEPDVINWCAGCIARRYFAAFDRAAGEGGTNG